MTSINPRLADLLPRLDLAAQRAAAVPANGAPAGFEALTGTTAANAATDVGTTPTAPMHGTAGSAPTAAPTLWDLLTQDERAFFKQQMALGPLTYRPGGAVCEPDAGPIGQRIDVKG